MQAVLIILIVLLVILMGAGVYFMYFKKDSSSERTAAPSGAPQSTLVSVRNAVATGRKVTGTFEMDIDDYIGMQGGAPFTIVTDDEFFYEQTEIERFRDPSISEEERAELADSLRSRGYSVKYPSGDSASQAVVEKEEPESDDANEDISSITDIYVLREMLTNPFVSMEDKQAAERRIAELEAGDSEHAGDEEEESREPEPDGNDDGGEDDGGAEGPDDSYGNGYVDPENHVSVDDPHLDEPYEPGVPVDMSALLGFDPLAGMEPEESPADETSSERREETPVEEESRQEQAPVTESPVEEPEDGTTMAAQLESEDPVDTVSEDDGETIDFRFGEDFDIDDEDSRKAIALMSFIARNFKDGLISPELVAFAQDKLNLQVVRGYWTPEQWARANQRKGVYHRDAKLENMALDEFDLHVKEVVASNLAAREKEAADEGSAETGEASAPAAPRKTGPGKPKDGNVAKQPRKAGARPVSAFFDAHGGKNDLMWQRLDN